MAKDQTNPERPQRSRGERLYGAAITKLRGEVLGLGAGYREILLDVLRDLDLSEDEVDEYIRANRAELTAALQEALGKDN